MLDVLLFNSKDKYVIIQNSAHSILNIVTHCVVYKGLRAVNYLADLALFFNTH